MFYLVPIFIGLIFIIVIGGILISIIKGIGTWRKNEQSPRLNVPVVLTSKRNHVSRGGSSSHTSYYVTFEFESKDRTEFKVSEKEYGQLSKDDTGILTFQGTRYLGFERN